jgi:hypothetical protein
LGHEKWERNKKSTNDTLWEKKTMEKLKQNSNKKKRSPLSGKAFLILRLRVKGKIEFIYSSFGAYFKIASPLGVLARLAFLFLSTTVALLLLSTVLTQYPM